MDVGAQLLKNAIDLLLGSDKVLEWRSIHLSHVSLILLDCDNGVASREEQGHRAVREETVSEPGNTQLGVIPLCGRGCRGAGTSRGSIENTGSRTRAGSEVEPHLKSKPGPLRTLGPGSCHRAWALRPWSQGLNSGHALAVPRLLNSDRPCLPHLRETRRNREAEKYYRNPPISYISPI